MSDKQHSYSKNNEPRIDFKKRLYGVKGEKIPSAFSRIFKCLELVMQA